MENSWIDCGIYCLNTAPQGSEEWLNLRKGRLTSSRFGAAVGHSHFDTPVQVSMELNGVIEKSFTREARERMDYGTLQEPQARAWYEKRYNIKVNIENIGLAVPKWDERIGASTDGLVGEDGMIEIKSVYAMYGPIMNYQDKIAKGWKPPTDYHDHIWKCHYDQMQGCMAVMNRKWCDYIVFCPKQNKIFIQRIEFNKNYWEHDLYPKLQKFLETLVKK